MLRSFKYFTVTSGTTQPLVGTTLSAAITGSASAQSVAVADSSMFLVGDYVLVGTVTERVKITAIADGTHITGVFPTSVATGANVRLYAPCTSVYVQTLDGNAGNIFIGNASTITPATGVGAICKLTKSTATNQPTEFSTGNVYGFNPENIANFWVTGDNTNDSYLPSFEQT